ncbi:F-box only protein 8-like [Magnolia sinica]|uniref:F-box only protein 8-like n=1 Tax=Magnolia sinica TaxID=86752 RepID=UPI00265A003A|nr:F-box only protein 8-like [Magnolia sinica]
MRIACSSMSKEVHVGRSFTWPNIREAKPLIYIRQEIQSLLDTNSFYGEYFKIKEDSSEEEIKEIVPKKKLKKIAPKKKLKEIVPKKKLKKTVPILPDDVIILILSKLPVKSLLRFRCVSRLWSSLIFDPYFIEQHRFEHANQDPNLLLLDRDRRIFSNFSLDIGTGTQEIYVLPKAVPKNWFSLSYCCHGLFLLSEYYKIHVCNPATRELITLPQASQHISFYVNPIQHAGLGYDDVAKQYKIVRFFNPSSDTSLYHMECEIFTLGRSDSWRRVCSIPYSLAAYPPAFVNGALYWKIETYSLMDIYTLIISFNLRDEKISVIPHPTSCSDPNKNQCCMRVVQLGGCLGLTDSSIKPLMDIWMLQDYTKHIWIKTYSINLETMYGYVNEVCIVYALAIHSNGYVSIYMNEESAGISQFSFYDPRTNTIINVEGCQSLFFLSAAYAESLIQLRRR